MYPNTLLLEIATAHERLATAYRQLAAAGEPVSQVPMPRGPKQAQVIAFLREHGPQPTARIAELVGDRDPARANTHDRLQRMEELGLVRRDRLVRPQLWQAT